MGLPDAYEKRADNTDRRAAGEAARAAAAHGIAMEDRRERLAEKRELFSVREALAREADPAISDAKLRAFRAGVLPAPGAEKGKTDIDVTMVRKFFTPEKGAAGAVHDDKGEAEFWDFVGKNNFRTTDQALMAYVQRERPKRVTKAEFDKLPSGAKYIDPKVETRTLPGSGGWQQPRSTWQSSCLVGATACVSTPVKQTVDFQSLRRLW